MTCVLACRNKCAVLFSLGCYLGTMIKDRNGNKFVTFCVVIGFHAQRGLHVIRNKCLLDACAIKLLPFRILFTAKL